MPFIVRYPELVRPGTVCDAMVLNIDFGPKLLDLSGVPVSGDMQGRSLRPLLSGERPANWRASIYYRYYPAEYGIPPQYGIRTERCKLIRYRGRLGIEFGTSTANPRRWQDVDAWELFDLQSDPDERINLYESPDLQRTIMELKAELERLQRELGDSAE